MKLLYLNHLDFTSHRKEENGGLKREISIFVSRSRQGEQKYNKFIL